MPAVFFGDAAAGAPVSGRGALAIADAYACVRVLADTAASLPLHVYRQGREGGRERADTNAARLLRHPAPALTQSGLVGQIAAHLNLHGNAFVGKYRDDTDEIHQLGALDPGAVSIELRGGMPFYTVVHDDGTRRTYSQRDVLHVKGLSLDGLVGLSPVREAREALSYAQALADHGSRFMRNGARPAGVLTVSGTGPDREEITANLRRGFESRHAGPSNAGKIAVLTADVKFEAVGLPLQDAEFIAQRELSTQEVCRIFRVPPWMVGAKTGDSLTYSTVSEQARAFVTFSLRPWLVAIEQAFAADADLFPPETQTYPAFELDGLLRGDPKARAEVYTAALDPTTGWMSRGEVRRLEDLPAEPDRTPEEAPADA